MDFPWDPAITVSDNKFATPEWFQADLDADAGNWDSSRLETLDLRGIEEFLISPDEATTAKEVLPNETNTARNQSGLAGVQTSGVISHTCNGARNNDNGTLLPVVASPLGVDPTEIFNSNALKHQSWFDPFDDRNASLLDFEWPNDRLHSADIDAVHIPGPHQSDSEMEHRGRLREAEISMLRGAGEMSIIKRHRRRIQTSGGSWDEQDHLDLNFCDSIQRHLDEIGNKNRSGEDHFITGYLSCKKRRLVHALAHLRRVNHMTLDGFKERRILVSTATIGCRTTRTPDKCWNRTTSHWILDPTTLIMTLPLHIERHQLKETLQNMDLPTPQSSCPIAFSSRKRIFLVEFDTAATTATTLDRIQEKYRGTGNTLGLDVPFDVSYRYWSHDTALNATFTRLEDADEQQSWGDKILFLTDRYYRHEMATKYPPPTFRSDWSRSTSRKPLLHRSSRFEIGSSDGGDNDSSRSRSSSKRPHAVYMSDNGSRSGELAVVGRGSVPFQEDRPYRDSSSESTAKLPKMTRTRHRRQEGGFPCREPDCGRMYDCNGERTKHEKSHIPMEDRAHACSHCEMKFNDRKDLRRHWDRTEHHPWRFPAPAETLGAVQSDGVLEFI